MKVTIMGEEVDASTLPEPEPELSYYFAQVTVTQPALDRASQVVPHEVWKEPGLHSWLTRRANEAFRKCKVDQREIEMGRLRYVFGEKNDQPILTNVILLPA